MDLKNINLMNDALFKAMMCHKNNRELVVDLLHVLTNIPKEKLKDATYISGEEIPKRVWMQKKQITDMSVIIDNKQRIIIEMNQEEVKNIFEKNSAYAFSVVIETTHKNIEAYPKVILINIDNFNKYKTDKPILNFELKDEEGHTETHLYQSIHLVLENIENRKYNVDEEIKKFARFLKDRDLEKLANEFKGEKKYMAAIRTVEELSTNPDMVGFYDYEEAKKQELEDAKSFAIEKGLEQGLEQGLKKGIEEGMKQGIEKGIQEGIIQEKISVAKKMLSMEAIRIEQISQITGLSIEEIEKLQNK